MAAAGGSWKGGAFVMPGRYSGEASFGRENVRREASGANRGQIAKRTIPVQRTGSGGYAVSVGDLEWFSATNEWSLKNLRGNTVARYGNASLRDAKRAATAWANQIRTESDL